MRGYDVEALQRIINGTDSFADQWRDIFDGAVWNKCNGNGYADCVRYLEQWGDGARAEIYIAWKGGDAHVFVGQNIGGRVYFFDPQLGKPEVSDYFQDGIDGSVEICRLDNLTPKISLLAECCKKVTK